MADIDYSELYGKTNPSGDKEDIDYSELYPVAKKKVASKKSVDSSNLLESAIKYGLASTRPLKETVPERFAALGKGFYELGTGVKQAGLQGAEKLGILPKGSAKKYTESENREKEAYEKSIGGKDPYNQLITGGVKSLPWMALGGPQAMRAKTIMGRLLGSAATGGAIGATEYLPNAEDRTGNIVGSALEGAGWAAIPELPAIYDKAKGIVGAGIKGNPLLRSEIPKLEESIANKKFSLEDFAKKHEEQLENQRAAITESEREHGRAKPSTMRNAVTKKQEALSEKSQHVEDLNKQLQEHENLPELPEIDTSNHEKNVANAEKSLEESHEHIANAENTRTDAEHALNETDHAISQNLNRGASHDVRAAAGILEDRENIRKGLNQEYEDIKSSLKQKNVVVNNDAEIKKLNEDLVGLIKENKLHTPEFKKLNEQLAKLENAPEQFAADEYLTMLRSAKDYARQARAKAFQPDMNAGERANWESRYNELDDKIEKMEEVFENAIGGEDSARLKEANNGWRTQVKPLQRNNTYQTIRHRGRIEGDIMHKLRGTDAGDVLMRETIKNNPETLKNVLGQRYAAKPHEIAHTGELENEYLDRMPEIKDLARNRENLENTVSESKSAIKEAEQRHKEIVNEHKRAIKNQGEAEKRKSAVESEKEKRTQQQKKFKEEIEQHKKDISKGNTEIDNMEKSIATLEKQEQKTDISEKDLKRVKKELAEQNEKLKQIKKDVDSSKSKLFRTARYGYRIGKSVIKKLHSIGTLGV